MSTSSKSIITSAKPGQAQRVRDGIAQEMGIKPSDIHVFVIPRLKLPYNPSVWSCLFGVALNPGTKSQIRIGFRRVGRLTVPRMIRLVVQAPAVCWTLGENDVKPIQVTRENPWRRAASQVRPCSAIAPEPAHNLEFSGPPAADDKRDSL